MTGPIAAQIIGSRRVNIAALLTDDNDDDDAPSSVDHTRTCTHNSPRGL